MKLIAVAYETVDSAESARDELFTLAAGNPDALEDAAVVVKLADGRVELRQSKDLAVGDGFVAGGAVGLLLGLALGGPVAGALVGMAGGGGFGFLDRGVSDDRMRRFGDELEPGHAAVFALVREPDLEELRRCLLRHGGELVVTDVPASTDPPP
jgi:uncharacterized membrane protein